MSNLYFIEYGCSCCSETLIVSCDDPNTALQRAMDYAHQAATDCYYSYDCNYLDSEDYDDLSEEEMVELEEEEMEYDIFYSAVEYDPENEDHVSALKEQDNKPHSI